MQCTLANPRPDILLSLTRTSRPGYLRDIRRLTVALSRARRGLYVFGRRAVFEAVPELAPAFDQLLARPDKLALVTGELFPTAASTADSESSTSGVVSRLAASADDDDSVPGVAVMEGVEHLGQYVYEMTAAKIQNLKEGTEVLPAAAAHVDADKDVDEDIGIEADDGHDDDEDEAEVKDE